MVERVPEYNINTVSLVQRCSFGFPSVGLSHTGFALFMLCRIRNGSQETCHPYYREEEPAHRLHTSNKGGKGAARRGNKRGVSGHDGK